MKGFEILGYISTSVRDTRTCAQYDVSLRTRIAYEERRM